MSKENTVAIYATGGCGINIASKLGVKSPPGFASMEIAYIDTSRSNMSRNDIPAERQFLVLDQNGKEIDGSGKERSANIEHIRNDVQRVLTQFKPSAFNLVIHSVTGGSGSVLGPIIVGELVKRGIPVIVLLTGNDDSTVEIKNGIKTLQTYDAMASKNGVPIICHCEFGSWAKTDRATLELVSHLLALLSGSNHGMDTADITKWLNMKVIDHAQNKLHTMDFIVGNTCKDEKGNIYNPISVASLVSEGPGGVNDYSIDPRPDYQAMGIVPKEWHKDHPNHDLGSAHFIGDEPLHFVIHDGISTYYNVLSKTMDSINERISASRSAVPISKNIRADDDGMVL